ncbi:MAG: sulfate transporter CysZ [Gammaproteobacteria bacterium]|nr:sulfate transporter CysZ [Gammaproteobacteria bacterium]
MNALAEGPKNLLAGFKLLSKPGVRLYVLIPFMLNSLLFSSIIFFGAHRLSDMIDWLTSNWTWTEWISWLLWPLFAVIALTIVFFCFSILANLIAAPFNGFLAQAVARHLLDTPPEQYREQTTLAAEILDAFKSESIKLIYFLVRSIPLLFLFFIPVIQVIAPFIWFIFGAWMLALEYMEYPMGNQGILFPEVRATLSNKRALTLSFGGSVMVLTMIPVLNFLVMPAAVAAATKLWLEKISTDSETIISVQK